MPGKQPSELARERDARLDTGSAVLARHLLAAFRPGLIAFIGTQDGATKTHRSSGAGETKRSKSAK
jgi:hypothetical protein